MGVSRGLFGWRTADWKQRPGEPAVHRWLWGKTTLVTYGSTVLPGELGLMLLQPQEHPLAA